MSKNNIHTVIKTLFILMFSLSLSQTIYAQCVNSPSANCDGDALTNLDDLDDDNDGILDEVECDFINTGNTTGTGMFTDKIAFFVWNSTDFNNGVQIGDEQTLTLTDGSVITLRVSNVSDTAQGNDYRRATSPTFSGAGIAGVYDATNIILYDRASNNYTIVRFTFAASAVDAAGRAFNPNIVLIDGERTDNGESFGGETNGTPWVDFEEIQPFTTSVETGIGTQQFNVLNNGGGQGGQSVYLSENVSSFQVNLGSNSPENGSAGRQGFAVGVLRKPDTDGDGVLDCFDTDSDNDGCPDAVEGSGDYLIEQLDANDMLDPTMLSPSGVNATTGVVNAGSQSATPAAIDPTNTLACQADLSLTKTVDNALPKVGDTITYSIGVTNSGAATATNVVVTDMIPSGLIDINIAAPAGTSFLGSTWQVNTLNINETKTLTITARIDQAGSIVNNARVSSSTELDPDSTAN